MKLQTAERPTKAISANPNSHSGRETLTDLTLFGSLGLASTGIVLAINDGIAHSAHRGMLIPGHHVTNLWTEVSATTQPYSWAAISAGMLGALGAIIASK